MDPFDQVFYPLFSAGCGLGAFVCWKASAWGFPKALGGLLASILVVWMGLFAGVHFGYGAWQTMPDPPDEAFSDGGDLMLSLLLGWLPSTLICLLLFSAAVLWRRITRSSPTSALAED